MSPTKSTQLFIVGAVCCTCEAILCLSIDSHQQMGRLPPWSMTSWIGLQSLILTMPGMFVAQLGRKRNRVLMAIGIAMMYCVPIITVLDVIVFRWIHERFLSVAMLRVIEDTSKLFGYLETAQLFRGSIILLVVAAAIVSSWRMAGAAADRVNSRTDERRYQESVFHPVLVMSGLTLCLILGSWPALHAWDKTLDAMARQSIKHPFCVFRLIGTQPQFLNAPPASAHQEQFAETSLRQRMLLRESELQRLQVNTAWLDESDSSKMPDVLIVIVESFRPEAVNREAMPALAQMAQRGVWCQNHFSSSNATNVGVFSIVNGLEPIWYERPVRYSPLLNRLFQQAGYELGFFAGHNDWRKFLMDGFINETKFDEFQMEPWESLNSDRRATQRAASFLRDRESRPPRLAILYLYGTHAMYQSYAEDRYFQPAADDRMLFPYTSADRDRVWNRYLNSCRTLDQWIGSLVDDDRIMLVTGDHGESFLEDGVCGHGVRISQFQNMTPAVFYGAGLSAQQFEQPTSHADLLPTLLGLVGIELTEPDVFDGRNLIQLTESQWKNRVFSTSNYLKNDIAIIESKRRKDQAFAVSATFSFEKEDATCRGAIDIFGNPIELDDPRGPQALFERWLDERFSTQISAR